MTANKFGAKLRRLIILGVTLAATMPFVSNNADARSHHSSYASNSRSHARTIYAGMTIRHSGYYRSALQCVPFARENSGIELAGNAANWWDNATGVYERGARPETGSVLNFRASGRMRMGHVAVVSNVLDSRNVEIDHANWSGRGVIGRNVRVIDVSPFNDWSAVRVALATGDFGSVYPTYGFIYDRPDRGTMVANTALRTPAPFLSAAPRDFRAAPERVLVSLAQTQDEEVAEASDEPMARSFRRGTRHTSRMALRSSAHNSFPRYAEAHTRASHGHTASVRQAGYRSPKTAAHTVGKHSRHRA